MRRASLLAVLLLASCGSTPRQVEEPDDTETTEDTPPPTPAPPAPGKRPPRPGPGVAASLGAERQLDAETSVVTAWDARVPVPAGWFVAQGPDLVKLQDPDREITIGLSAIDDEENANVAILTAWRLLDPTFALPVNQSVDLPGRDGWDSMTQVSYVTRTEDARLVVALARKKGATWHVITLDGTLAAVDRRGAQTSSIANDLTVPGLEEESYADNPATIDKTRLAAFAKFVESARQQTGVPGVAVAVVHGGKIVLQDGFGVRSIRSRRQVVPTTRFMIGSTTKALTSLLVARLVDQGKLTWDTPVTTVLPDFALADPEITGQVQVRHTLCACTGMPRQDLEFLFEYQGWDAERRLASMAAMKPTTGFGETFQYSNVMVATGGWLAGRAYDKKAKLGPGYERALRKLVLEPLKMKRTSFDFRKADGNEYAAPHGQNLDGSFVEIPVGYETAVTGVAPAGGAWSTVGDLASYMMVELAKGKDRRGRAFIGEEALLERRKPGIKIDSQSSYGLGLMITEERGITVLHHAGNTLGFTSDLFMLPDHDLGVVVLANAGATGSHATGNAFRSAVRQAFLEIVFDGRPLAQEQLTSALGVIRTGALRERQLIAATDGGFIAPLVGTYQAPGLGTVTVEQKAGAYRLNAGEWWTALARKDDRDRTVKLVTTTPPYLGLELVPRGDSLVLDAAQQVYTFTRAGGAAPADDAAPAAAADDGDE